MTSMSPKKRHFDHVASDTTATSATITPTIYTAEAFASDSPDASPPRSPAMALVAAAAVGALKRRKFE
jgi:MYXO-CTERM domain-containing protein